jgi:hypothetical protein
LAYILYCFWADAFNLVQIVAISKGLLIILPAGKTTAVSFYGACPRKTQAGQPRQTRGWCDVWIYSPFQYYFVLLRPRKTRRCKKSGKKRSNYYGNNEGQTVMPVLFVVFLKTLISHIKD